MFKLQLGVEQTRILRQMSTVEINNFLATQGSKFRHYVGWPEQHSYARQRREVNTQV